MRRIVLTVVVFCSSLAAFTSSFAGQPAASPLIHHVTLQPDTGVLTIAGTGLSERLAVLVDGQPTPVLAGATETQLEVAAPTSVVSAPGTYRVVVMDPIRHVGDVLVVTSQAANVLLEGTATAAGAPAEAPRARPAAAPVAAPAAAPPLSPAPMVIEDSGSPYRTAIGYQALFSNHNGSLNTATGYETLHENATGTTTPPAALSRSTPTRRATTTRRSAKTRLCSIRRAVPTRPVA
jgi:hypothetical protein